MYLQTLAKPANLPATLFEIPVARPRYHHARLVGERLVKDLAQPTSRINQSASSRELQGHQVCDRALGISSGVDQTWRHHPSTGQGGAVPDSTAVPER